MTVWLLATMIVMAYMGVVLHLSMRHMESIRHLEKELEILKEEINEALAKHEFKEINPMEDESDE